MSSQFQTRLSLKPPIRSAMTVLNRMSKNLIFLFASILGFSIPVSAQTIRFPSISANFLPRSVEKLLFSLTWSDYIVYTSLMFLILLIFLIILTFIVCRYLILATPRRSKAHANEASIPTFKEEGLSLPGKIKFTISRLLEFLILKKDSTHIPIPRSHLNESAPILHTSSQTPIDTVIHSINNHNIDDNGWETVSRIHADLQTVTNNFVILSQSTNSMLNELRQDIKNINKKVDAATRKLEVQRIRITELNRQIHGLKPEDHHPRTSEDECKAKSIEVNPVLTSVSDQLESEQAIQKETVNNHVAMSLAKHYQVAFHRNDRQALRRLASKQLNITQDSENLLMKSTGLPTRLEVVQNGGSYLLAQTDDSNWLVPEFQILSSFTTNQLAKGIFTYDRENISAAELRRPAEVREVGGYWEVVNTGIIAVPC